MVIAYLLMIVIIFVMLRRTDQSQLDIVGVNDIVQIATHIWIDEVATFEISKFPEGLDFTIITNDEEVLLTTRDGLNTTINTAISNQDTLVNIIAHDQIVGKVIFYNNSPALNIRGNIQIVAVVTLVLTLFTTGGIWYVLYLHKLVIKPFEELEAFAKQVALGNLNVPLAMDKHNLFGAFTESFDLMREELHKAREAEREANQSKKELVAQLSHDIKTPVASIKAVAELMQLLTKDATEKERLDTITMKAEQINTLITDMFHATLEELQALPVTLEEFESHKLADILRRVDYQQQLKEFFLPDALIIGDLLRIEQVFDNIITNAYKYAKTQLQILACLEDDHLVVEILDFGAGVPEEELPLLLQKFYRGSTSTMEIGYGLGLYISNYLMTQMNGGLEVCNRPDGFTVRLKFSLVGQTFLKLNPRQGNES